MIAAKDAHSHRTSRRLRRGWPIVIVAGAFVLGWAAASVAASIAPVTLRTGDEFTGVITLVNYNGSKFCFTSDGDGKEHCSVSYQQTGSAALQV
jgi:hypothetical protein